MPFSRTSSKAAKLESLQTNDYTLLRETSFSDTTTHPDGEFGLLVTPCLYSQTQALSCLSKTCDVRCGSHLQDGPIEAQQDAPWLVPNSVQAVREAAKEELVAQTTPGGQMVRQNSIITCRDWSLSLLLETSAALAAEVCVTVEQERASEISDETGNRNYK